MRDSFDFVLVLPRQLIVLEIDLSGLLGHIGACIVRSHFEMLSVAINDSIKTHGTSPSKVRARIW